MEPQDTGTENIRPRPDYPPKTPPPPKKPPSLPPPQTRIATAPVRLEAFRGRRVMANRQGATWSLEAQPWVRKKAVADITARLAKWGLRKPAELDDVVLLLVSSVVGDGGRQISVHLAEQDHQALILVLSHRPEATDLQDQVLPRLHDLGAVSCGTELTPDGRQVWAVLDCAV
ncbi:hypothetical protein ACIRU8_45680 [Streptomyces sp. NPDC101175]|uniref:hypothetical protein n=1 Tax=Streptomyces sp. NPDC101175 TaxID=3366123 RepID=UPI00383825F2